ncbi:MAG: ATP-binding cassette domain-containing protein [Firmicutes bacterium]|nr:ATP-binding cassette domain-containing protein [Bacillota bacterium]
MIAAKNVSLQYPDGTVALKNINLSVKPGELVYITGPSGSGKTSLLKLLMAMEFPTTGTLEIMGRSYGKGQTGPIRQLRRMLGPVFQDFKLIKGRTALENIMLGMRFLDIPASEMKKNATEALARVGLKKKANTPVENLSWGECQRISIARVLARKPLLILADEPTGNLDRENALNILELLVGCKDEQTAVLITTHATHLIPANQNRIIRLKEGVMEEAEA